MKTTVFINDVVVPNNVSATQPNSTFEKKNHVKRRKRKGYEP